MEAVLLVFTDDVTAHDELWTGLYSAQIHANAAKPCGQTSKFRWTMSRGKLQKQPVQQLKQVKSATVKAWQSISGGNGWSDVHGLSYELLMIFIHPYIENDVSNLLLSL